MNRYEIALDLDKTATRRNFAPVVLRQNDLHGCEIAAIITDHGKPIGQDGLAAYFALKLPSGAYYRASAEWDGTVALVVIDEHCAASELGKAVPAYFELRDGTEVIATTQNFPVRSIESATDGPPAESYDSLIEQAIDRAEIALDTADDANRRAEDAIGSIDTAIDEMTEDANERVTEAIGRLDEAIASLDEHVVVLTNAQIDEMFG